MKLHGILAAAALLAVVTTQSAVAQARVTYFVGGGLLSPAGEFAEYAKTGYLGVFGVSLPTANSRVAVDVLGFYGHAEHEGLSGEGTNIPGVATAVNYVLVPGKLITPRVSAMAGLLQHRYDPGATGFEAESETSLLVGVGAGLGMPVGGVSLSLNGRYVHTKDTAFLGVVIALAFGGG